MEVKKQQKIGTYFKKENIFLATVSTNKTDTKEMLKSDMERKESTELIELFVDKDIISSEQYDVFYKSDMGYIRFVEEGPETFSGDDSDGKGIIRNVVSIWEYYSEEQVIECLINNEFMAIVVLEIEPLNKYNDDYNKV